MVKAWTKKLFESLTDGVVSPDGYREMSRQLRQELAHRQSGVWRSAKLTNWIWRCHRLPKAHALEHLDYVANQPFTRPEGDSGSAFPGGTDLARWGLWDTHESLYSHLVSGSFRPSAELVAPQGFEPRLIGSEPTVLPLNERAIQRNCWRPQARREPQSAACLSVRGPAPWVTLFARYSSRRTSSGFCPKTRCDAAQPATTVSSAVTARAARFHNRFGL